MALARKDKTVLGLFTVVQHRSAGVTPFICRHIYEPVVIMCMCAALCPACLCGWQLFWCDHTSVCKSITNSFFQTLNRDNHWSFFISQWSKDGDIYLLYHLFFNNLVTSVFRSSKIWSSVLKYYMDISEENNQEYEELLVTLKCQTSRIKHCTGLFSLREDDINVNFSEANHSLTHWFWMEHSDFW